MAPLLGGSVRVPTDVPGGEFLASSVDSPSPTLRTKKRRSTHRLALAVPTAIYFRIFIWNLGEGAID
jgi:hypothetical protein